MQWDKEQLRFQPNLAFHLRVAKNFFNDFFVTWVHKEFANLHVVEFNRKSQNTWTPQNLFMTWAHKEFAQGIRSNVFQNSTENAWNWQNLAS